MIIYNIGDVIKDIGMRIVRFVDMWAGVIILRGVCLLLMYLSF